MKLTGELCVCTHDKKCHPRERDGKRETFPCVAVLNAGGFQFCKCRNFKSQSQGENAMPKEKKQKAAREKKPKVSGRKPTLAPFVDAPFKIYATYKDKEYDAMVLSSGIIKFEDKEYATPSGAAVAIVGKPTDGYVFWSFNKNDKRVPLDMIRGEKSPLAEPKAKKAAA